MSAQWARYRAGERVRIGRITYVVLRMERLAYGGNNRPPRVVVREVGNQNANAKALNVATYRIERVAQ